MQLRDLMKAIVPARLRSGIKNALLNEGSPLREVAGQIAGRLPEETIATIVDVGANIGQSSSEFAAIFPHSRILAFEPDPTTFEQLLANLQRLRNVQPFNYALGAFSGRASLDTRVPSDRRRISTTEGAELPTIEVQKLDDVATMLTIDEIDYLKVDTEGHDLEVLKGAASLLSQSKIKIIEAECGMNRENQHHVPFGLIHEYLENFGYRLFYIFEQAPEWPVGLPHLRRINAVFISPDVILRNRRITSSATM